jgi:hypothetical protein
MINSGSGRRLMDRWVLLVSVFGGSMAWAVSGSVPIAATTAMAMWGVAVAFGGGQRRAAFRGGTQQHGLVTLFDGHVRSLRSLRGGTLPDAVRLQADDALVAADAARSSVVRMAAAIDALDETIALACNVSGRSKHAAESIDKSVARMRSRRDGLVEKLTAAVDEVATIYAGLLELSVTARTMGVTSGDGDVGAVNDSVTLLQMTFAELEADARRLAEEGFRAT